MSGVINILLDTTSSAALPHDQVVQAMEDGVDYIETYCTDFFCFDVLDKDYDVIAHRGNGTIVLSALLDNEHDYTVKEIRRAHNARKMLMAGALKFREMKWHT